MVKIKPLYLILLLGILILSILVGGTLPYFILYVIILLGILPLIHSVYSLMTLRVKIKIDNRTYYNGDSLDLEYKISNLGRLPILRLEIQNSILENLSGIREDKKLISLKPGQVYREKISINLNKRGHFHLGHLLISILDIFNISQLNKPFYEKMDLVVYPKIIKISRFSIQTTLETGDLRAYNNFFYDKSQIKSLRDYTENDSIKDIHWKLTSKQGRPILKEYDQSGNIETNLILVNSELYFLGENIHILEDLMAEVATSLVSYYMERNIKIKLQTQNKGESFEIQSQTRQDLKSFLLFLASFQGNGEKNGLDYLNYLFSKTSDLHPIIITPYLDKDLATEFIKLKLKNIIPTIILVGLSGDQLDKSLLNNLEKEYLPIYYIDKNSSIKDVLEGFYGWKS